MNPVRPQGSGFIFDSLNEDDAYYRMEKLH